MPILRKIPNTIRIHEILYGKIRLQATSILKTFFDTEHLASDSLITEITYTTF